MGGQSGHTAILLPKLSEGHISSVELGVGGREAVSQGNSPPLTVLPTLLKSSELLFTKLGPRPSCLVSPRKPAKRPCPDPTQETGLPGSRV